MKHFTTIIAALLLSAAVTAQNKYDDNFTQTRLMKASGKTTVKTGHMTFDGADHLTMTYTDPDGEYFIAEGSTVRMNLDGKKNTVNAAKVKTVDIRRTTLLNCLSGNWEEAAKINNAETKVSESKGMRTVLMSAVGKVPRGGYSSVALTYRMSDGKLTKMVLEESTGVQNTYEIAR